MGTAVEIGRTHVLRVAAVWGTTVVGHRFLSRGESYPLGQEAPDGLEVADMPLRAVPGGWELDAKGAIAGMLKLRGRDEDPVGLGKSGAPIPIVPGDYGLLQYGLFSVFFQYQTPAQVIGTKLNLELLVFMAMVSSGVLHVGLLFLVRALMTPPPIPKPMDLISAEELAAQFHLERANIEEHVPPAPAAQSEDKGGGSGVKDPGAKDKKPMGGGKPMPGERGKLGYVNGKAVRTEMPGEVKPAQRFDMTTALEESGMKETLSGIRSVSDALSGLNSATIQRSAGTGMGDKLHGAGGGGTGPGTYGAGDFNGLGYGRGDGRGTGSGGPGGAGNGGAGRGGSGGGSGGGNGTGTGTGNGPGEGGNPGERGVAGGPAAPGKRNGLTPQQVQAVVGAHTGSIRQCYDIQLARNPGLKGNVGVSFTIGPGGNVLSASASGSIGAAVAGCVQRQFSRLRFPTSDGTTISSFGYRW